MGKRVCLFGGTFDPIHFGHLRIAQKAVEACALDVILFIPAGNPPHKDGTVTAFEDRYLMVEIACQPFAKFKASRLEEGPQRSYTVNTVRRFRTMMEGDDSLFFLIGADAFEEIKTWKEWEALLTLVEFIVVARPGRVYGMPDGARIWALNDIALEISSSEIRAKLAAGQTTPEVPDGVCQFIRQNGLYGFQREATVSL
jgi:nicotinate-nucleotide adenylyltransferase